jgi:NAD(P)H-hydrate epimerase
MTTLTRAQVRKLDRRAIEEFGVPGIVLMENAGRGAAQVLMQLNAERKPVIVLCGKGNNGGDGHVIARHLDNHGWPVSVWSLAPLDELRGDAAINAKIVQNSGISIVRAHEDLDAAVAGLESFSGWLVDALFGTGFTGALNDPYDRLVDAINASRAQVLAVDIPSGLDCDTGVPLGSAVRAHHTVTFVAAKAGFANSAASAYLGQVHVVDIGAPRKLLAEFGVV